MAVIEYDEYKQKLQALEPTLGELEKALGIPKDRQELKDLQAETEQDGFWNNIEHSQKVSQQIKRLEHRIRKYDRLVSEWEDTVTCAKWPRRRTTLPAAGGHRRVRQPGKGDQRAPSGGSAVRRIRRQQRHSHLPRRCRRHRGPGLGRDALPHVHPLGRAPRLHLSAHGL